MNRAIHPSQADVVRVSRISGICPEANRVSPIKTATCAAAHFAGGQIVKRHLLVTVFIGSVFMQSCAFSAGAQTQDHPRLVVQRPISVEVSACAWSQDGRIALTGNINGKVRLLDPVTGAQLQSFWGAGRILHATLSADNQKVLTITGENVVQQWDAATGKQLRRFVPPSGSLIYGAVFPDGSTVATARWVDTDEHAGRLSPTSTMNIQIWNVETGKEVQHYLVPGAASYLNRDSLTKMAALSSDASKLLTGGDNGPQLWDLQTGKLLRNFSQSEGVVTSVAISPDARWVAAGSMDSTVRIWNLETGDEVRHFAGLYSGSFKGSAYSEVFSPDGQRVLTTTSDGLPRLWDVATGKELHIFEGPNEEMMHCAALSPDGREVLTGGYDQTARLWDAATGVEIRSLTEAITNKIDVVSDEAAALAVVEKGRAIVTVSKMGMAWKWDAETGKALVRPLRPAKEEISPEAGVPADSRPVACCVDGRDISLVVLSADGQRVFMSGARWASDVWDVETGNEILRFDSSTNFFAGKAAFAPGNHSLMVTTNGATVKLWDLDAAKELHSFFAHTEWRPRILYPEGDMNSVVETLAVSPDGKRVLTGDGEGTIQLWNMETGSQLQRFKIHTKDPIMSMAFSPDGRRMLTEDVDNKSKLRNVSTGWVTQQFAASSYPSFSTDGSRVLIGYSAWDVKSGKLLQQFTAPINNYSTETLFPDGSKALIAYPDGGTKLWDVKTGKELATLYCFSDGSWAVIDPESRFDTDKFDGNIALHWAVDSNPDHFLPLAAFKDRYYTPRLLARILSGEKLPPVSQNPAIEK